MNINLILNYYFLRERKKNYDGSKYLINTDFEENINQFLDILKVWNME